MNHNVQKLCTLASKDARRIIGLMSGTSLDGLDIALCQISGHGRNTRIVLERFSTISYNDRFRREVRSVFSRRDVDLERVCLLNGWIGLQHAAMINRQLEEWGVQANEVDLVASHGQSIYHAPKFLHPGDDFGNATLQVGDGDHISVATGIITVSDFRQKHVAAGGEGAPLAVYGDYLIFSKQGEDRIMLNIGGIANFTYLPGDLDAEKIFSTDTGPGNTLMDAYMQAHYSRPYDKDAAVASAGQVHEPLLRILLEDAFFAQGFPKTTGPELFNLSYLEEAMKKCGAQDLSHEDVMATLNRFSADSIANAMKRTLNDSGRYTIYTSGGGMHNPLLMERIRTIFPGYEFRSTAALEVNPDAKEAVLFAVLANECVAGGEVKIGDGSSGIPSVCMGKISFPS